MGLYDYDNMGSAMQTGASSYDNPVSVGQQAAQGAQQIGWYASMTMPQAAMINMGLQIVSSIITSMTYERPSLQLTPQQQIIKDMAGKFSRIGDMRSVAQQVAALFTHEPQSNFFGLEGHKRLQDMGAYTEDKNERAALEIGTKRTIKEVEAGIYNDELTGVGRGNPLQTMPGKKEAITQRDSIEDNPSLTYVKDDKTRKVNALGQVY